MSEPTEQQVVERLRQSIVTAMNDDLTKPMTDKRERHVARVEAMQDAIDALSAAAPGQAEGWQPGDRRCVECDSGLEPEWVYCPFCAKLGGRLSGDGETPDQERKP